MRSALARGRLAVALSLTVLKGGARYFEFLVDFFVNKATSGVESNGVERAAKAARATVGY